MGKLNSTYSCTDSGTTYYSSLNDIDIIEDKVSAKLDRLRDDKAVGADDLLPRFLSSIKKEIVSPLAIVFRKVISEETVPSDWREANVPIFKGGQRSVAANYRPVNVSLTSQISKIFEAVVPDEMVEFLEKHSS